jgi:hypothetical protein
MEGLIRLNGLFAQWHQLNKTAHKTFEIIQQMAVLGNQMAALGFQVPAFDAPTPDNPDGGQSAAMRIAA